MIRLTNALIHDGRIFEAGTQMSGLCKTMEDAIIQEGNGAQIEDNVQFGTVIPSDFEGEDQAIEEDSQEGMSTALTEQVFGRSSNR